MLCAWRFPLIISGWHKSESETALEPPARTRIGQRIKCIDTCGDIQTHISFTHANPPNLRNLHIQKSCGTLAGYLYTVGSVGAADGNTQLSNPMNTLSSPIRAEAHHASLFPSYTMHTSDGQIELDSSEPLAVVTRTLLVTKGIPTSNKDATRGAPGLTTSNKNSPSLPPSLALSLPPSLSLSLPRSLSPSLPPSLPPSPRSLSPSLALSLPPSLPSLLPSLPPSLARSLSLSPSPSLVTRTLL